MDHGRGHGSFQGRARHLGLVIGPPPCIRRRGGLRRRKGVVTVPLHRRPHACPTRREHRLRDQGSPHPSAGGSGRTGLGKPPGRTGHALPSRSARGLDLPRPALRRLVRSVDAFGRGRRPTPHGSPRHEGDRTTPLMSAWAVRGQPGAGGDHAPGIGSPPAQGRRAAPGVTCEDHGKAPAHAGRARCRGRGHPLPRGTGVLRGGRGRNPLVRAL